MILSGINLAAPSGVLFYAWFTGLSGKSGVHYDVHRQARSKRGRDWLHFWGSTREEGVLPQGDTLSWWMWACCCRTSWTSQSRGRRPLPQKTIQRRGSPSPWARGREEQVFELPTWKTAYDKSKQSYNCTAGHCQLLQTSFFCMDLMAVVLLEVPIVGVVRNCLSGCVGEVEGEQAGTQSHWWIIMVKVILNICCCLRNDRVDSFGSHIIVAICWIFCWALSSPRGRMLSLAPSVFSGVIRHRLPCATTSRRLLPISTNRTVRAVSLTCCLSPFPMQILISKHFSALSFSIILASRNFALSTFLVFFRCKGRWSSRKRQSLKFPSAISLGFSKNDKKWGRRLPLRTNFEERSNLSICEWAVYRVWKCKSDCKTPPWSLSWRKKYRKMAKLLRNI